MKPLRPSKKWVLAAIGLLLALLILKIVLFLTAKPKITVDYVVEYNRTSRPQNYNPNDNAAPYYQKAFDAFVEMPEKLQKPRIDWPADFNDAEQAILEQWLTSNSQAFEYFREALNKPYYWLERKAKKDNYIGSMTSPDLAQLRELTETLIWDAKLKTIKGQFQPAFENILGCYRAGSHKCRPTLLLIEQHAGLRIKQDIVHGVLVILDRTKVEIEALKFFQNALQPELDNDAYVPSIQTEKYFLYDRLQRTFIDNGKGTGRLAFNVDLEYITLGGIRPNLKRKLYYCLKGPTRNEIVEQIERVIAISDPIMNKTPWQIKNKESDYLKEIQKIKESNYFSEHLCASMESIFHSYHKTKAQTEALIAILATLRYKIDIGQFPETLNELVSSGYLQAVPNDPYSSSSLVYKLTEDDFKLYSVGKDFSDDGGMIEVVNEAMQMPGFRGTSIIPHVHSPDIVYWPVKDLMKLRYEFTFEEAEKLRAEKGAEAEKRTEEPNHPE